MLADALGRPLRFIITAGQAGDVTQAPACFVARPAKPCSPTKPMTATPCACSSPGWAQQPSSPSNRTRKVIIPHDATAYRQRNRIERCFCHLKHFRRFATRYDRRSAHFAGFIHLAAAMIWLR
ncbi:hypothetical protein NWI01_36070 [Nitrobacter winogradskyi]|uniref:Transposase DDE domain-containing protein n=3 Tax=Nitrobacter winogradskyi TaxID=913 RepID=A0A4Y3WGA6_NITWI|nr:hypothetical protein NWI01_36070 [Nitrobacter winogradskyi]